VASIFEPHTAVIRKGKKAKPTESGNLITIQEAEHQIVAAYAIQNGHPPIARSGAQRSSAISRSLGTPRTWRRPIAGGE
jgi:hypothetical protein